jgi:hypothetical protein
LQEQELLDEIVYLDKVKALYPELNAFILAQMGRARNRRGFGWKRWSRQWLYDELKLFNGYRVNRMSETKASPT